MCEILKERDLQYNLHSNSTLTAANARTTTFGIENVFGTENMELTAQNDERFFIPVQF